MNIIECAQSLEIIFRSMILISKDNYVKVEILNFKPMINHQEVWPNSILNWVKMLVYKHFLYKLMLVTYKFILADWFFHNY